MILFRIIFVLYIIFAFKDIKHAVIAWVPIHCLFNPAVVLWGFSPVLALSEAIGLTLPVIFLLKKGFDRNNEEYSNESFIFNGAFVLYLLSYGFSTLFSEYNTQRTLLYSLKFFVNSFLLVYMFQRCLVTMQDIKFLLWTSISVLVMAVALGVSELVLGYNVWSDYIWRTSPLSYDELHGRTFCVPSFLDNGQRMRLGVARIYSFFNLHLNFGSFCAIMLFFIGVLWKNGVVLYKKWLLPLCVVLCYIGAFICNSKGPLLLAIVLTPMVFPVNNIVKPKILIPVLVVVLTAFLFFSQYIEIYFTSLLSVTDDELAQEAGGSSVALREQQLEVALKLFENNPIFGSGPQSLRAISNTFEGEGILGAESIWIKTLPELGIVGIVAFLSFFLVAFRELRKALPFWELLIILAGIGLIETTNGRRDMLLYAPLLIAIRQFYILNDTNNLKLGDEEAV